MKNHQMFVESIVVCFVYVSDVADNQIAGSIPDLSANVDLSLL